VLAALLAHGVVEELEGVQHLLHLALGRHLDVDALAPLLVVHAVALGELGLIGGNANQRRRLHACMHARMTDHGVEA
jgi:hypothetical protein